MTSWGQTSITVTYNINYIQYSHSTESNHGAYVVAEKYS